MVIHLFENLKQVIRLLNFNYCNLFMWEKLRHGWHSIPACIPKMVKVAKTYGKRCNSAALARPHHKGPLRLIPAPNSLSFSSTLCYLQYSSPSLFSLLSQAVEQLK